jgi:hypothetical protein
MYDDVDVPNAPKKLAPSATTVTSIASPQQPPTTADMTTADGNGRTASSKPKPKWLRSPNRLNCVGTARSSRVVARSASGPPPLAHGERIGTGTGTGTSALTQTQYDYHLGPRRQESQPPPALHRALSSSSPSPAVAQWPSEHPVGCGAKRKANDAASGDEEQREWEKPLHRDGDRVKGGEGKKIWISEVEGERIRMETIRNQARRATAASGEEIHGHGKRTKRTATTSDDGTYLSLSSLSPSSHSPPVHEVLMIPHGQIQTHASRGNEKLGEYHRQPSHPDNPEMQRASVSTLLRVV